MPYYPSSSTSSAAQDPVPHVRVLLVAEGRDSRHEKPDASQGARTSGVHRMEGTSHWPNEPSN